jgi:hypothetical protein
MQFNSSFISLVAYSTAQWPLMKLARENRQTNQTNTKTKTKQADKKPNKHKLARHSGARKKYTCIHIEYY